MRLSRHVFVALAAAGALYACGFPDFQYEDEDGGVGGSSPTSSSTTSGGGHGGATSQGGGPPACDLLDAADPSCGQDTKCGIVDENSGQIGCVGAGERPIWARCDADPECAPGLFCDPATSVCRPFCETANDCPSTVARCLPATKSAGGEIPGVKVCSAHCQPMSGVPCDDSNGPTTCFFDTSLVETDCGATANANIGATCVDELDCVRGALCVTVDSQARCREVCTPPGGQAGCLFNEVCADTSPKLDHNGATYGVCVPLF